MPTWHGSPPQPEEIIPSGRGPVVTRWPRSRFNDIGNIVLGADLFKILRLLLVVLLCVHVYACAFWKVPLRAVWAPAPAGSDPARVRHRSLESRPTSPRGACAHECLRRRGQKPNSIRASCAARVCAV